MRRLHTVWKLAFHSIIISFLVLPATLCTGDDQSLCPTFLCSRNLGLARIFAYQISKIVPMFIAFWILDWYLFQHEMRAYEARIWEYDPDIIAAYGDDVDVYIPELSMYKIYQWEWEDNVDRDPADLSSTWEEIKRDLHLQFGNSKIYTEELKKLEEFLIWKEAQACPPWWRKILSRNLQEKDVNLPSWLRGQVLAKLQIAWETLEVRADTLADMAIYTADLAGEERSKKIMLTSSICAEYLSVKKHMEYFRSKGWSSWLGVDDIDEEILSTCNSLRCVEGVWDILADYELQQATWCFWRKWEFSLGNFDWKTQN
ncbi:uncharacterized protein RSE6_12655 [Rhynchosporium secalis]|uniref:Uncharacterized protein n=1 Tax=Rhynchosporium secalis TaxID=38038 RepID=A0A1E1MQX7_RHYSE|nr:uncharacterized protein RSE6_12655 [Rhynchosporium secalis]